jgi:ketosteroid isomerase-like protein
MYDEIREFGKAWAEAERLSDAAGLGPMLADDFVGVGPFGFTLTKEQWIGSRASGDLVHTAFGWDPADIRVYADTAVVVGVQTQESTYQGRPAPSGPFRVTQILVRPAGRWVLAGMHLCVIQAPPGQG